VELDKKDFYLPRKVWVNPDELVLVQKERVSRLNRVKRRKLQRDRYRKNTLVKVENIDTLSNSFSNWPSDQIFRVSSDDGKPGSPDRYIFLDSYSMGIKASELRLTTQKERSSRNLTNFKTRG
jgi:hypothetical protein